MFVVTKMYEELMPTSMKPNETMEDSPIRANLRPSMRGGGVERTNAIIAFRFRDVFMVLKAEPNVNLPLYIGNNIINNNTAVEAALRFR